MKKRLVVIETGTSLVLVHNIKGLETAMLSADCLPTTPEGVDLPDKYSICGMVSFRQPELVKEAFRTLRLQEGLHQVKTPIGMILIDEHPDGYSICEDCAFCSTRMRAQMLDGKTLRRRENYCEWDVDIADLGGSVRQCPSYRPSEPESPEFPHGEFPNGAEARLTSDDLEPSHWPDDSTPDYNPN